jgi:predicted porin
MKKTLIGLSLSILTMGASFAQTAEVYGKVRLYVESDKIGLQPSITKQTSDTSRIGFRGTEDLGNGVKAFMVIETAVDADTPTATSIGGRNSIVGLSNSHGSLELGRTLNNPVRILNKYDALMNDFGTSAGTVHSSQGARHNNGVYLTLTPNKHVTARYHKEFSENSSADANSVMLDVSLGKVDVGTTYYKSATTKTVSAGVRYKLPDEKTNLFAIYSEDTGTTGKTVGTSVGVRYSLTSNTLLMASAGHNDNLDARNFGIQYSLSKRTHLHFKYRDENNKDVNKDRKQIGIGLETNF